MSTQSSIEWTESTWNPLTGCTKISPGCKHCYAERMAKRLQAMGQPNYANGFDLTIHAHVIGLPLTWKKPQMIFVNSMSDLFHEAVPLEFIQNIFTIMRDASWHPSWCSPSARSGYWSFPQALVGPKMSGWESASKIRSIPIVSITFER
jgi:protein gp37